MENLGKYKIVKELGRGGMGVVYKGYDALMEREVAIKVISDSVVEIPEMKSRFYREARTAGGLSHENITVIYDVGEDGGKPFIVMEYLQGSDLGSLLEGRVPIPLQQKLDYAIQICRGLSYSHSRGIIHRDIKPANIRITNDGKVKIMDFGIARPEASNLTRSGAVMGTPFYMSPEQIQGRKVDKRSDIFSFGVLLYEMLAERKPFTGDEVTAVMYQIVHEEPKQIDDVNIEHRDGLRQIVLKTLAKDPERRWQDLSEVAERLENVLRDLKSGEKKQSQELRIKISKLVAEGRNLLQSNKLKKARETAERARLLNPASTDVARLTEEIKRAEDVEARRVFVEQRLEAARKAFNARRYEQALELLRDILKVEPDHREAARLSKSAQDAIRYVETGDSQYAETQLAEYIPTQAERGGKAAPAKQAGLSRPPSAAKLPDAVMQTGRKRQYAIIGVLILAIGAALVYRFALYTPAAAHGYVALNILPWAQVTKIVSDAGTEVTLSGETVTPCRLALPEGSYDIHLANPSFKNPLIVSIKVRNNEAQEVKKKFPGFDYQQLVKGDLR